MPPEYEILAVRYGVFNSTRGEHFYRYGAYGLPDGDLLMDYFFWVIRDDRSTILVDTGYHPRAIESRPGRECLIPPVDALRRLGIEPEMVSDVIVTHLHFDHIGNLDAFPRAKFTVQQAELDFWTGPYGTKPASAASVEASEISFLVEAVKDGRGVCVSGGVEIAPGIKVRQVPGHCPGQQIVIVDGERPRVLTSDALHFYEELERDMPYEVFTDLVGMYETYGILRELEEHHDAVIVAGHDPAVMSKFEPLSGNTRDLAVRIG